MRLTSFSVVTNGQIGMPRIIQGGAADQVLPRGVDYDETGALVLLYEYPQTIAPVEQFGVLVVPKVGSFDETQYTGLVYWGHVRSPVNGQLSHVYRYELPL